MTCYRKGGCGPYEMYSCSECPASKPEYLEREHPEEKKDDLINQLFSGVLSNSKRCDLCKQPYNYNYPIKVRSGIDGEIYKINTVKRIIIIIFKTVYLEILFFFFGLFIII